MDNHRAAYRWTIEELDTSMRRHMRAKAKIIPLDDLLLAVALNDAEVAQGLSSVMLVTAVASIVYLLSSLRDGEDPHRISCLFILMLAVSWGVGMARSALALRRASREFSQSPGADQMVEWELSATEVKFYQRGLFYTAQSWKNFVKVVEAEDGFLLYTHERIFHWLPFRAFETTQAIDDVRAFAQASGVPFKKIGAVST